MNTRDYVTPVSTKDFRARYFALRGNDLVHSGSAYHPSMDMTAFGLSMAIDGSRMMVEHLEAFIKTKEEEKATDGMFFEALAVLEHAKGMDYTLNLFFDLLGGPYPMAWCLNNLEPSDDPAEIIEAYNEAYCALSDAFVPAQANQYEIAATMAEVAPETDDCVVVVGAA